MNKNIDIDMLLEALYDADAISARGAKIIREFPAADVVTVRHGRWREVEDEESRHLCECSICKEWLLFYYDFVANYCPNCGAKMDWEDDTGK